ncbi:MAG TPA: HAMP domain-containing sensor histidine kinase [Gemmatimonadaceae bacterium]|jgi:signal transduction histidine kinase|nr:HAMP domain-containing sensor histidine kinase [Gemmatimonadaceae bacterium]
MVDTITPTRTRRSLRTQLILVVLVAALVPLMLLALWLARASGRAGEMLLAARLEAAVLSAANEAGVRWVEYRSSLLDLADAVDVRRALGDTAGVVSAPAVLPPAVRLAVVRDASGAVRWARAADTSATGGVFRPLLAVWSKRSEAEIGSLEAALSGSALVRATGATGGTTLAAFDRRTGVSLLATPFDPDLATKATFTWNGERWLVARRVLDEPAIEIVAAAPVADYEAPFADAARRGLIALLIVAALSTLAVIVLTRRITRALGDLALAADGVSRGDMGRTVPVPRSEELGRLAEAFNTMSESLRRTLDSLARRESLAAVGEFAASLSHEVRNPLTAMRLDLQRVEEKLDPESPLRAPLRRALRAVDRLQHTVSGALRVARSGQVARTPVDLLVPLDAALHASEPEMQAAGARVKVDTGDVPLVVLGDAAALEQLFLNLLLNAAQAFDGPGGVVRVRASTDGEHARIEVEDAGRGMSSETLAAAFEPFVTTRAQGTGLGLAIARRIAAAHGGELSLESVAGTGTVAAVTIPRAP